MKIFTAITLSACLVLLLAADFLPKSSWRMSFVGDAEAIIGMPFTPLSYAGVARRTMYRHAVYTATAVNVAAANAAAANAAAANAAAAQAAAANAAAAQASAANAAAAQAAAAQAAAAAAAAHAAQIALPIGSTVPYLPPNCTSSVINGVNYFNCSGTYYKAGFQGNNIVYIVSVP